MSLCFLKRLLRKYDWQMIDWAFFINITCLMEIRKSKTPFIECDTNIDEDNLNHNEWRQMKDTLTKTNWLDEPKD